MYMKTKHNQAGHAHDTPGGKPPAGKQTQSIAMGGPIYTCSMHPEVRQDHPGPCPKCGMTLERAIPLVDEVENPELVDFSRRFFWTLPGLVGK